MPRFANLAAAAAVASLLVVGGSSAAAELILNGDFDANSPPAQTAPLDWTFTAAASGSDFFIGLAVPYGAFSTPNAANFGALSGINDELSQTFSTVVGQEYTISFELAQSSTATTNSFIADWNGTPVFLESNSNAFGYTLESFTEVATSTSTTLAFFGSDVAGWYELDNVSVTGATPEPAAWALMLVGFGALGLAMRGARCRAAAA